MRKYTARSRKFAQSYVETIVITLFIGLTLRAFVIAPYQIPTQAMSPALESGDYVFVFKLPFGLKVPFYNKLGQAQNIHRGDVVLFYYTQEPDEKFLKRIIGLAGDKIDTIQGRKIEPMLVPEGQVFLVGDNPGESGDGSRYWAMVPIKNIDGKVVLKIHRGQFFSSRL